MGGKTPFLRFALPPAAVALAGASLLVQALPGLAKVLVYDRQAVLGGELWRLWSGHLVHFSAGHLLYNVLALLLAGCLLEKEAGSRFGLFCLGAAPFISVLLFLFAPEMQTYGGLSGLAVGAFCVIAVLGIREGGGRRWVGRAILTLVAAKLVAEGIRGEPLLTGAAERHFVPALLAHVAGGIAGLVFGLMPHRFRGTSILDS